MAGDPLHSCNFRLPALGFKCSRPREDEGYCYFHHPKNHQPPRREPADYAARLQQLLEANDGCWIGFLFPTGLTLEGTSASPRIDARHVSGGSFAINSMMFEADVDFSDAKFSGEFRTVSSTFKQSVSFRRVRFSNEFHWNSVCEANAEFGESEIAGWARIYGPFNNAANFNGVRFSAAAEFVGGWIVNFVVAESTRESFPRAVFGGEVGLQNVDFGRPERTQFKLVDLSKALVCETDFRGVQFSGVKWDSSSLGRRAIFDEISATTTDLLARRLPTLETAYRNLRTALEESRDFQSATDFYVGELEARRLQQSRVRQWVSIEGIYRVASIYGSSPGRASLVLGTLLLSYTLLLAYASLNSCDSDVWLSATARAIHGITLLGRSDQPMLPGWWFLLEDAFRLLLVVQVGLLGLAVRNRIRRG